MADHEPLQERFSVKKEANLLRIKDNEKGSLGLGIINLDESPEKIAKDLHFIVNHAHVRGKTYARNRLAAAMSQLIGTTPDDPR